MKKLNLLLALSLLFAGCSKNDDLAPIEKVAVTPDPVASFTIGAEYYMSQPLVITNASENATSYLWDFGDETSSTMAVPVKTYAKGGTYTVKLTAKTADKTSVSTKTVIVHNGTHSVVIKNNTTNTFDFTLFDRINFSTIGTERFKVVQLKPGAESNVFYTSKLNISVGGVVNGFKFGILNPESFLMEVGKKNTININNDTKLVLGLEVPE